MYRSWHSDPNERPTLSFIKRVLLLTSNILSKAEATYAENITPTNVEQCENIWMELEGPSATESSLNNENVVNQSCSQKTEDMANTERNLSDVQQQSNQHQKEKTMKSDQILTENENFHNPK